MAVPRKYSDEIKARAVRLVLEAEDRDRGATRRIAKQLDINYEMLRPWIRQAKIDHGDAPGLTSDERARLRQLEKENRELRRANEILKDASAFFARELDSRHSR